MSQSTYEIPAIRAISGIRLDGRPIRHGDPVEVRRAKWLQHAVRQEQWPTGTTFEDFCDSIISTIKQDESGIYVEQQGGDWKRIFVGRSGEWEGLEGADFIFVKYDCREQRLVTAPLMTVSREGSVLFVEHVEEALRRAGLLGTGHVTKLEPLSGGKASTVHRVTVSNGRSVVLKSAEARVVEAEALWLRGWREIGVDTPEVYAHGVLADQTPYLLMELVDGPSVEAEIAAGRLPHDETVKQTGRMLAMMHTVRGIGFGSSRQDHLDAEGHGQFQTLREQLAAETLPLGLSFALEVGAISERDLDAVERAIDVLSEHVASIGPRRTHGDFRIGNMLRHGDRLVVIDPTPALTHPYICLAYSLLEPELFTETVPAALLAGYDEVAPVDTRALDAALLVRAGIMFHSFGRRRDNVDGQRLPGMFARLRHRFS